MHITIHQLRLFLRVCQVRSITKAAREMLLTQPALSIQLKNLQAQFDIPLIEVIGRRIHITDFGLQIAESAENIIREFDRIHYQAMLHKGLLAGKLRISVVSTGKYVMPYFLTDFLQMHNKVELVMDVTNKSLVVESLQENTVDFALMSILPDHVDVSSMTLMSNKLVLVGNRVPRFATKSKPNPPHILNQMQLIFREPGSGTRLMMERFLEQHNINTQTKMELTSNEAVKQAVLASLGYSIMPVIGMRSELKRGDLVEIPIAGLPLHTDWHLAWLTSKKHTPIASALLSYLQANKQNVIQTHFT